MGKMNIINRNGRSLPECTQCEHRFETDYAKNPYSEKVYCLYQECQKETEIIELEIDTIEIHKEYIIINGYKGEHCYRYFLSVIGKTVFLTKEEAEKALKAVCRNEVSILQR